MRIRPARRINGALSLPGDKAISHRAALLSALARGTSRIENFSTGDDCAATLSCLKQLGVSVEFEAGLVHIEGVGLEGLRAPHSLLDCRNSGSTMRMLGGILAGQNFESTLTGDESLQSRPMKRIIEPLELMGARVASAEGRAPLHITGRVPLKAISYEMPVASAQVKSCILLAGLYAKGRTEVIEACGATRDHTERMLHCYGVNVKRSAQAAALSPHSISLEPPAQLRAYDGTIPGDISSAAFFIAAAALLPGSNLEIQRVGLNPTRTQFLSTLRSLGVSVSQELMDSGDWDFTDFNEIYGYVFVSGGAGLAPVAEGKSNVLRGALIPQLIDELPMLAVLGTQVMGGLAIRDAAELRLKETDRIAATVENLRAMGVEVEEHEDGLTIRKRTHLRGARLNTHNDHRIAMAFSVAALLAGGDSEIEGAECVSVSFPEFYTLLESVVER